MKKIAFLFLLLCVFSVFSCPPDPPGPKEPEITECVMRFHYKYNDDNTFQVMDDYVEYKGYIGDKVLGGPADWSAGRWHQDTDGILGWGYFSSTRNFKFSADTDGFLNFVSRDGVEWSTADVIPKREEFDLYPVYSETVKDCDVIVYYTSGDNTVQKPLELKKFSFQVPCETKLINYKDGEPSRWSNGKWQKAENGKYLYTLDEVAYTLKEKTINNKKVYYFNVSGKEFSTLETIEKDRLILNSIYEGSTAKVTVKYISNKLSGEVDLEKSFTFEIPAGSRLSAYGDPTDWANMAIDADGNSAPVVWNKDENNNYSYTTEADYKYLRYKLKTTTQSGSTIYYFKDADNANFTSEDIVKKDITLKQQ